MLHSGNHIQVILTGSLSTMLTIAEELAPSVATETLLNVTVNDSGSSTVSSSAVAMLIVWLPERQVCPVAWRACGSERAE